MTIIQSYDVEGRVRLTKARFEKVAPILGDALFTAGLQLCGKSICNWKKKKVYKVLLHFTAKKIKRCDNFYHTCSHSLHNPSCFVTSVHFLTIKITLVIRGTLIPRLNCSSVRSSWKNMIRSQMFCDWTCRWNKLILLSDLFVCFCFVFWHYH